MDVKHQQPVYLAFYRLLFTALDVVRLMEKQNHFAACGYGFNAVLF